MFRWMCGGMMVLAFSFCGSAQEEGKPKGPLNRFGYNLDEMTYPQKTPQETMKSIALALSRRKVEYMLAHLVDPHYVDYWIERYKAAFPKGSDAARTLIAFDRLVNETHKYYVNDPLILKELRQFAKDAEWEEKDALAVGSVKTMPGRKAFLRRVGDRWFLENRQQ
jgi:hypothetical protein